MCDFLMFIYLLFCDGDSFSLLFSFVCLFVCLLLFAVRYGRLAQSHTFDKIQLDNDAWRTQTKEMNKHVHSNSFVCVL